MRDKVITAGQAAALIKDGVTVATAGFVGIGFPEALAEALEQRFLDGEGPHDLTLVYAAGQGDGGRRGLNHLAHPGMLRRVIGGHWGLVPGLGALARTNAIEAYNLPQGVIAHLYRDIAAGRPGHISRIGLGTFVDPRQQGGRLNDRTPEGVVRLIEIDGETYLFYKTFPIHVALLRGTTADAQGNVTLEREALVLDALAMAQAARNSGGRVIVQVERLVERHQGPPKDVRIPGILVDHLVVAPPELHDQTFAGHFNPAFCDFLPDGPPVPPPLVLGPRKVIGRRAARLLKPGAVVNLGIGMPEAVASVAAEEDIIGQITLTVEPGGIGGIPASGLNFGAVYGAEAIIDQAAQFDFYDGGGLDQAFLGMAEVDREGNVNVSRFGHRLAGAGGFINISQSARELVFVGAFSSSDAEMEMGDGRLTLIRDGARGKFVSQVSHLTFNAAQARARGQSVCYVTERAVFQLTAQGLRLTEVAPGIDMQRDVLDRMAFQPLIPERPRLMAADLFRPSRLGLRRP
ncbi:acyl CoA:acetate/3-ketoacid CoA transferase [Magnetospira thiophila]